jgi:hypothetical protein
MTTPFLSRQAFRALQHAAAFFADPRNFPRDHVLIDGGSPYDEVDLLVWSCRECGVPAEEIATVLACHGYLRDARGIYRHHRRTHGWIHMPPVGTAVWHAFTLAKEVERIVGLPPHPRNAQ